MSEPPAPPDLAAVQRTMTRLDGFTRGVGLDALTVRLIVEEVIAGMPESSDDERLAEARKRMLKA